MDGIINSNYFMSMVAVTDSLSDKLGLILISGISCLILFL